MDFIKKRLRKLVEQPCYVSLPGGDITPEEVAELGEKIGEDLQRDLQSLAEDLSPTVPPSR